MLARLPRQVAAAARYSVRQPVVRRVSVSAMIFHDVATLATWNTSTPQWLNFGPTKND